MALTPGYGETPVPDDDAESLLPNLRESLGEPVSKAAVYDLEQAVQEEAAEQLLTAVLDGRLTLDELLSDHALSKACSFAASGREPRLDGFSIAP